MGENKTINILVIWRDKKLNVEIHSEATLKEFGHKLQHLTNVRYDTLRLLLPKSSDNSSKLLSPFSDDHSSLSLKEASIAEGKSIRMMGVFEDEIKEVLHTGSKADLRILGFEEEERRLRQRMLTRTGNSFKLPQGAYIFGDFRTLHLPGIELNPPPSEALKRMHRLAADPGIVAIMNKHRWRVGIMTEMAPVGYVGVSPTCILGLNKNQGEEISLRLRTDDLKGFRKYESIKKTLLHELAHMVYSQHDAHFYALDKQLNQEAASLDWTRSRSHTLTRVKNSEHYEEESDEETTGYSSQKLGGRTVDELTTARASSVAAAYRRLVVASTEPDPDDSGCKVRVEPDPDDSIMKVEPPMENDKNPRFEPDPDDDLEDQNNFEGHEDSCSDSMETEPDPDDLEASKTMVEPDPDDSGVELVAVECGNNVEPDPDDTLTKGIVQQEPSGLQHEPDPDEGNVRVTGVSDSLYDMPDPNDQEIQRIQDPVSVICTRLQKTIEMLKSEVRPAEATLVLQTLSKIIGNVIAHPDEIKFRRLRKTNPNFQRNVAKYKAAMEVLNLVGFNEDTTVDEIGRSETYVVLKRNDPGLLWLVKSSLEMCIAY